MDGHKDALTDAALEREIESALTVDPSPEFLARIRSRVATEPVRSRWSAAWQVAGVGIVMATAVIVFVSSRSDTAVHSAHGRAPRETMTRATPPPSTAVSPPRAVVPQGARRPSRAAVTAPERRENGRSPAALPQVVIAENERRGFELFLEELRDQEHAAVVAEAAIGRGTPGPPWLEVEPVIITPLSELVSAEGEAQ